LVGLLKIDKGSANKIRLYNFSTTATDDLEIRANAGAVAQPRIILNGSGALDLDAPTGSYIAGKINNAEYLRFQAGWINLKEISTPTAVTDYGAIYTKNDNNLYFQDGAGAEHTVAFV
jgi:hypothetical protein